MDGIVGCITEDEMTMEVDCDRIPMEEGDDVADDGVMENSTDGVVKDDTVKEH